MKTPVAPVALAVALAACAQTHPITPQVASGDNFAGAQPIEVSLSSFHFAPGDVRLKAGQPIALKLVNSSSKEHNFTAPEFFAAAKVAPGDAGKIAQGQVELKPGATAEVRLIPAAGRFHLVCTEVGHAALGMRGTITVG